MATITATTLGISLRNDNELEDQLDFIVAQRAAARLPIIPTIIVVTLLTVGIAIYICFWPSLKGFFARADIQNTFLQHTRPTEQGTILPLRF